MTRAKGPAYNVQYRRRREGTTDFAKRLALIKSGKPRMVVRKSNKGLVVQFIEFDPKGDKTLLTVNGAILKKALKWESKRNVWTAYLAGLYAGKEAGKKGVKEFVFDMGRYTPSKGNILFAVVKGAADSGLKTNFSDKMVPSDKLANPPEALKSAFEKAKSSIAG
ncbi:MAG: 50S ribosomal protein L18 [Candidatus Micrarchaeota archaeon]